MMRHIRDTARAILSASNERLALLAAHDPDAFRDISAALLCAHDAGQRHAYIVQQAHAHGGVNRSDIEREFGVSTVQASTDLQAVLAGGSIAYDKSAKCYVPKHGEQP